MIPSKEIVTLDINGMTCAHCAMKVRDTIESSGGSIIDVDFSIGKAEIEIEKPLLKKIIIENLTNNGYKAKEVNNAETSTKKISPIEKKFYFCLILTIPLFSHMLLPFIEILQNPIFQISLCIPVLFVGLNHFGKSAFRSISSGTPNMDVLITIGFTTAFIYSLTGTLLYWNSDLLDNYLFYETTATIITLVLLGNLLEYKSVKQTTSAIAELSKIQAIKATKIVTTDNKESTIEVDCKTIVNEDILLVNLGEKIPVDGIVIWGEADIDESLISGESLPIEKSKGDTLMGGTLVVRGNIKMKATAVGNQTILSQIIELVKKAQSNKPEIQKFGDRVSAIFVPIVLGVSITTLFFSYYLFSIDLQHSLMNAIAVLVISCPCAMGLATPTAVMVGIGRAAKQGILIKGGSTLESFSQTKHMVFDKTGTLTSGKFKITQFDCLPGISRNEVEEILVGLEMHSSHPIAKSIKNELNKSSNLSFETIKEENGLGIHGKTINGNKYRIGSFNIAKHLTSDNSKSIYVLKNEELIATLKLTDLLKESAIPTIDKVKKRGIKTHLLSGDSAENCKPIASEINIDNYISGLLPEEKLNEIEKLLKKGSTSMIGDGVNDAPALAKSTVGVSLGNATPVAIQSSQIILLNGNDLDGIIKAMDICKHTYITIKQNLFWALFYNVIAIPIAAMGFLNPMIAAMAMAFSDVIVIGNSIRLKTKKLT